MVKMGRLILTIALLVVFSGVSYAQSDWHTYPARAIAEIVKEHESASSKKADLVVSADPFPSKTVVTYTGKHRPVDEYGKFFIGLWSESRNLPPENAGMLSEEYLFKEKEKEYWIPAVKTIVPFFDKELKEGEEITIYYFFLGGYNEKTLREKKKDKTKEDIALARVLEDKVKWVFAVEEFEKPALTNKYVDQPLAAALDKSLVPAENTIDFLLDPRQVRSKSRVIFTGEVRNVDEKKLRLLQAWAKSRGLPAEAVELLRQEARFREGDKDYWLPTRKKILEDMTALLKKSDAVIIHTILIGGVPQADSFEWVFIVGEFTP